MPKMSGIELAKNINETMPNCKVIIVSGYGEFEYAKKAIEYNVVNYLLKPINMNELIDNLKRLKTTLDEKILENNLDALAEQREQFFYDLLTQPQLSISEVEQNFTHLKFPFTIENSAGILIEISLNNYEQYIQHFWKYGKENIVTAIINVMQKRLINNQIYSILQRKEKFILVIFNQKTPVDLLRNMVIRALKDILSMEAELNCLKIFDSIYNMYFDGIFEVISKQYLIPQSSDEENIVIKKAKAYIEANYDKDITRDDVAEYVHFNSAYFSKYFKQKTGESFYDYLVGIKMRKAIELLGTKMKIYDICEKVGYKNIKYFNKNFKQFTSYTPSEYRKHLLKKEGLNDET